MAHGGNMTCGVIFDLDGVLVDSYQAHYESWRRFAAEQEFAYSQQQFAATFGRTSREILAHHWPRKLSAQEIAAADDRKEELYRQIIRENFPIMPGARELVRGLHAAGFRLAVGSSAPPANVELSLDLLGLRELFGAAVTGRDVTHGKPDPQVFLLAAGRLALPPNNCAVVEDAPAGIQAALAGGMTAIAITGTVAREQLSSAHLVVDRLEQLTPVKIERLIRDRLQIANCASTSLSTLSRPKGKLQI